MTFPDGAVPSGGSYVRVTGDATIGGVTSSYTVYTYVASNTTDVAATELTSIAVGLVADGVASFSDGVDQVAAGIEGLESANIVDAATAAKRDATVSASMMAISNQFENGAFVPGTSVAADANASIGQCIAMGGLAWDNMSKVDAGGTGVLPAAEPNKDYQRCKACHGWDQRGASGGYARRSRKSTRPNAGAGDPNDMTRNVTGGSITLEMVLHAGTGRSWADGSAIFDSTDPWGPGAQLANTAKS